MCSPPENQPINEIANEIANRAASKANNAGVDPVDVLVADLANVISTIARDCLEEDGTVLVQMMVERMETDYFGETAGLETVH